MAAAALVRRLSGNKFSNGEDHMSTVPLLCNSTAGADCFAESETAWWLFSGEHEEECRVDLIGEGHPGNFTVCNKGDQWKLSVKVESGEVDCWNIFMSNDLFCLQGSDTTFTSLAALVDHYSCADRVDPLPIRLRSSMQFRSSRHQLRLKLQSSVEKQQPMNSASPREDVKLDLSHLGTASTETKPVKIDNETHKATWFASNKHRLVVKAMAQSILQYGSCGHFLIRDKISEKGTYALMVNTGEASRTYLIEIRGKKRRFALLGTVRETFDTIMELVNYYSESCRPSLGIQLIAAGEYLEAIERWAEAEIQKQMQTHSSQAMLHGIGEPSQSEQLPAWLRVDKEIKNNVTDEMRERAKQETQERPSESIVNSGFSDEVTYSMASPTIQQKAKSTSGGDGQCDLAYDIIHSVEVAYDVAVESTYDIAEANQSRPASAYSRENASSDYDLKRSSGDGDVNMPLVTDCSGVESGSIYDDSASAPNMATPNPYLKGSEKIGPVARLSNMLFRNKKRSSDTRGTPIFSPPASRQCLSPPPPSTPSPASARK